MAIQGIIKGFADPSDLGRNLILVGRGSGYVLLVDGQVRGDACEDLGAALEMFKQQAVICRPWWVEVLGLETPGIGPSKVSETGRRTVADVMPDDGDGDAQQTERNRG